jgi:signal transduction histidine kinase
MKLGFSEPLESDFRREYSRDSLPIVRIGLLLGAFLYVVFLFLDIWMLPRSWEIALRIRLGLALPVILGTFALTFTPVFQRFMQSILTATLVIAGSGMTLMIAFASPSEPGFFFYDKALLLAVNFTYTFFRLRFFYTTLVSLSLLAGYEVVAIYVHGMISNEATGYMTAAFIENNFFFLSTIVVAMVASYWLEAYARKNFEQRRIIEREKTSLVTAMDELKSTQAQLVQSERAAALGSLVAGLTHELSSPIAAITSSAETSAAALGKWFRKPPESVSPPGTILDVLRECTRTVDIASRRVKELLESLKRFSNLDRAAFGIVEINESLETTLAVMTVEIGERVDVIRDYGSLPRYLGYAGDLNQLFMSLLRNAVQAIPGQGTIRVVTAAENGSILVRIADTGVGMNEETLGRLFVPAFSADGNRVKAGLGLFVAHRIVEKHEGRIHVESEIGRGTTVTIELPLRLPPSLVNPNPNTNSSRGRRGR